MTIYCYGLDFCSRVCQSYHVENRKCIYYVQKGTEILYEWRSMCVNSTIVFTLHVWDSSNYYW